MFTLTIKELAARKLRLLTTAFAVLLGVAFMAGTMVFTDTIGATFDSVLADADEGVDAYVRAPSEIDLGYGEPGPRLDASLAADRRLGRRCRRGGACASTATPSWSAATARPSATSPTSPAFGTNWVTVDELNPYELASGRAPATDDEIVIDKASADKAGYRPGDVATVLTKQRAASVHDRRHRHVRHRRLPRRRHRGAVHRRRGGRAAGLARRGRRDRRHRRPGCRPGGARRRPSRPIGRRATSRSSPARRSSPRTRRRSPADFAGFDTIMMVFAFVAVFVGCVHHQQHVLDHRRAAHPRDGDAASDRCVGPSGQAIGADRGGRRRRVGVGARAWSPASAWPPGCGSLMSVFGFDMPDGPIVISDAARW